MNVSDLTFIDSIVERIGCGGEKTIPLLQAIQEHYRYLPVEALRRLSELTGISPARIAGVSTFYTQFRHTPAGRHIISICHGTACHVKGAETVRETLMRRLGIEGDADTSADGEFTIQKVACLGCCTLAPVIQIDNVTYGHLTGESIAGVLADFLQMHKSHPAPAKPARRRDKPTLGEIRVGLGSCCLAKGSGQVRTAMEHAVREMHMEVAVKRVGCVGMCHQTPMVEIVMADGAHHHYARVEPADAPAILRRHFKPGGLARRISGSVSTALGHLLTDETWAGTQRLSIDEQSPDVRAFLSPQVHLATEFCGRLDPLDLEEYQRHDGFAAMRKILCYAPNDGCRANEPRPGGSGHTDLSNCESRIANREFDNNGRADNEALVGKISPENVVELITRSGLRGRGGAGFPTGKKWSLVAASPGDKKYIICNGDEGDPGAFMDRMILESYPYRVIEGMIIAAYAAGCHEGVFYIRAEYPLAVQRIDAALEHVRNAGLLGENILGSGFSLDLRIMEGAGAFVCGEETALIASIEGRRGMPRIRPPYPANRGLWDRPTLVNNVETFALVPWIIRHGPEAFAAVGDGRSKGTKVFALAGKVARGGLIEAPMGISLRQIVEDIGGGIAGGKKFKAVQVGGPSGGCLPAELCDVPVDYERLAEVGAIMGSGGLVVLDQSDCMVDIARYFLEFTQDQSCGKCTFCRIGTRRMLDILTGLCEGKGKPDDIDELQRLACQVKQSSLCGLGKTAPNPVLTTLKYFRQEYEEHIAGRCPAGRCRAMIHYVIGPECIGCTRCAQRCPVGAILPRPFEQHEIDDAKCTRCDACRTACPVEAIKVK